MKKHMITLLCMAMTIGLLTGCADEEEAASVSTLTPLPLYSTESTYLESASETEETTESVEQLMPLVVEKVELLAGGESNTIGEREVVNGKMQSWLTGEWKDAKITGRRNMAVMIDNKQASLPQYGISKADVIYEAPIEGRVTRLMALFEDYDDLDHIGPVRSARDYYLYEAIGYDSIYCNWGLARPWVEELINSDSVDNVSQALAGIENGAPEAYDRISRPGINIEHTGYLFINGYNAAMERLGYAQEYREVFERPFAFAAEGYAATYDGYPGATHVYPGGTQNNQGGYGISNPCFAYNDVDRKYYRSQYGAAQVDEMTGEQLAVSNVIFKVCHGEERFPNDPNYDYLAFRVHGEGAAYIFTNGKVIQGTWKRETDTNTNRFYDSKGNEVVLNQGKTWICCIWDNYSQYISWE